MQTKVLKVRGYVRVSSREQVMGFSIDNQIEQLNNYLHYRKYDNDDYHCYVDEGKSAKSIKRPALQLLINEIQKGDVDIVIIYKLDRLSRKVVDVYELLEMMVENQCSLVAIMDDLNISSANGRMFIGMLAVIAQWERETIIERTRDGMNQMCEEGKFPFGYVPFGYTKSKDLVLSINEKEASAFKFIVNQLRSGKTISEVEILLAERFGIHKRADSIKLLIQRYYYTGQFCFDDKAYDNIVPALVSKTELDEAHKALKKRISAISDGKFHYIHKIRCGCCGDICSTRQTKKKNNHIYYYYCEKCNLRINQKFINSQVLIRLFDNINHNNKAKEKKECLKKITALSSKINNTYNQYRVNAITEKAYGYTLMQLQNNINAEYKRLEVFDKKKLEDWTLLSNFQKIEMIDQNIMYITCDLELNIVIKINFK